MSGELEVRPFVLPKEPAGIQPLAGAFEERLQRGVSILSSVNKVVASLPAGTKFALVAHARVDGDERTAEVSAFVNLGRGLSFAGTFGHEVSKGFSGEASLVFSR